MFNFSRRFRTKNGHNPFDDDDDDDDDSAAAEEDEFQDCVEFTDEPSVKRSIRAESSLEESEVFSPLVYALMKVNDMYNRSFSAFNESFLDLDDENDEEEEEEVPVRTESRLLRIVEERPDHSISSLAGSTSTPSVAVTEVTQANEHGSQAENQRRSTGMRRRRTRRFRKQNPSRVLTTLGAENEFSLDHHRSARTPWAKLILVEDFGTASSWTVLLIPYIAFAIALFLELFRPLRVTTIGPFSANLPCPTSSYQVTETPWLRTVPQECFYSVGSYKHPNFTNQEQVLDYAFQTQRYESLLLDGVGFASGPISNVPPMTSFLQGDASFHNISSAVISLVSEGLIVSSTVVLQSTGGDTSTEWKPVFVSKPLTLSMVCTKNEFERYDCKSPTIINMLFAMPGSGILSGDDLQINVLFGFNRFVPTSLVVGLDIRKAAANVQEAVSSSQYTITHESTLYANISFMVHLGTLLVSSAFIIFWCRSLGMKGFLSCFSAKCRLCRFDLHRYNCCCFGNETSASELHPLRPDEQPPTNHELTMWWESPWILFPERRYILVLLVSLLMLQNPMLIVISFNSALNRFPAVHAIADAIMGLGANGTLMMILCIFEGLRFHTATVARQRAEKQFHIQELGRALDFVRTGDPEYGTGESLSLVATSFYEKYGDTNGSALASSRCIRLAHDPCGDDWADFLLAKLCLLATSVVALLLSSITRFPPENVSVTAFHWYNTIYVASSLLEFALVWLWIVLIVREASRTGALLRKEPFLSTRPVQLAYRILVGILFLGLVATVVPLVASVVNLVLDWTIGGSGSKPTNALQASALDPLSIVLIRLSQRFPYIGSAGNIGGGNVLYVTVCSLVASIIFLPSRSFQQDNSESNKDDADELFSGLSLTERGRRKRDKRTVVTLARYSNSWSVFPLPIKPISVANMLSDVSFQLGPNERSAAFFGSYTPIFCLEIACWLLEASWQAYYSPVEFSTNEFAPGRMSLESIGLQLEKAILDSETLSQVYVATNSSSQVDGEEDSIIVVSFRGTANARNMSIDLKLRQTPLLEQIIGIDEYPMFRIGGDGVRVDDADGWFWDTPYSYSYSSSNLKTFTGNSESVSCTSFQWSSKSSPQKPQTSHNKLALGTEALIRATKIAGNVFPYVHSGFLEVYCHLRKQVLECVVEVYRRQLQKSIKRSKASKDEGKKRSIHLPKVYVTGHSLGGSLAQLLALDLASNCEVIVDQLGDNTVDLDDDEDFHFSTTSLDEDTMPPFFNNVVNTPEMNKPARKTLSLKPPIGCYTYGQPRVGNHAFARLFKQRVPHMFRVVNEGDAVTTMPTVVMCGGQYKHAGLEVMLDEGCTGNILVGPTIVETFFRFTKMRTSVSAHSLEKYRENLESGLGQEELEEYYQGYNISGSRSKSSHSSTAFSDLPKWLTKRSSQFGR